MNVTFPPPLGSTALGNWSGTELGTRDTPNFGKKIQFPIFDTQRATSKERLAPARPRGRGQVSATRPRVAAREIMKQISRSGLAGRP